MKRSIRRHHAERLMKNRKNYYGGSNKPYQLVDTPTPCSCPMCGNPRKWFKYRTQKEIQSIDELKYVCYNAGMED